MSWVAMAVRGGQVWGPLAGAGEAILVRALSHRTASLDAAAPLSDMELGAVLHFVDSEAQLFGLAYLMPTWRLQVLDVSLLRRQDPTMKLILNPPLSLPSGANLYMSFMRRWGNPVLRVRAHRAHLLWRTFQRIGQ